MNEPETGAAPPTEEAEVGVGRKKIDGDDYPIRIHDPDIERVVRLGYD